MFIVGLRFLCRWYGTSTCGHRCGRWGWSRRSDWPPKSCKRVNYTIQNILKQEINPTFTVNVWISLTFQSFCLENKASRIEQTRNTMKKTYSISHSLVDHLKSVSYLTIYTKQNRFDRSDYNLLHLEKQFQNLSNLRVSHSLERLLTKGDVLLVLFI